jgi:hypothetical protein
VYVPPTTHRARAVKRGRVCVRVSVQRAGGGVNRGGERRVVAAARNSGLINELYRGRGRNRSVRGVCVCVRAFVCECVRTRRHCQER